MKKILAVIIIIGLAACLLVVNQRMQVETSSRKVELVFDYPGLQALSTLAGEKEGDILESLQEAGLTSLAIYPKTVGELMAGNLVNVLLGKEIVQVYSISREVAAPYRDWIEAGLDNGDYVFFSGDAVMINWLAQQLGARKIRYTREEVGGTQYLWVHDQLLLSTTPLGFAPGELELVRNTGLKVVPRFKDYPGFTPGILDIWLEELEGMEWGTIIFAGNSVPGYPAVSPWKIAEKLRGRVIGYIEPFIGYQEGIKDLVVAADLSTVRVHSIQQKEMDRYSPEKVVDRYLRAVRERNVKVLYLKPFLTTSGKEFKDLIELNVHFIKQLKKGLQSMGYETGVAKPFPVTGSSRWMVLVLIVGVVAAGLLLINQFIRLNIWVDLLLGGVITAGFAFLMLKGYVFWSREVAALGAAVIFPSLAGVYIEKRLGLINGSPLKYKGGRGASIWSLPVVLVSASLISLLGGLYIASLLFHTRYLLKVSQFRGVKISFLLPLLLVSAHLIFSWLKQREPGEWREVIRKLWWGPLRWKHVIITGLLGLMGLIYIGRTGNYPLLPVPSWELWLREALEDWFAIRPRFKEFLLGHPAFFLLLIASRYRLRFWHWFLLLLTMVGQINIVNTFSHLHTPFLISLWRTILGLGLGFVTGYVLIILYRFLILLSGKLEHITRGSSE